MMLQNSCNKRVKSLSCATAKQQRGASLIGMAFIIGIVLMALIIAMKVVPAFTEFMTVKNILTTMSQGSALNGLSKSEIISSFDKRASIDNVQSVHGRDLEISTNEAGSTVISVDYQVVRPVMGNVSALIEFSASSDGKKQKKQ